MLEKLTETQKEFIDHDLDLNLESLKVKLSGDELERFLSYIIRILKHSTPDCYPNGTSKGKMKMNKSIGKVLGTDLEDYLALFLKIKD